MVGVTDKVSNITGRNLMKQVQGQLGKRSDAPELEMGSGGDLWSK